MIGISSKKLSRRIGLLIVGFLIVGGIGLGLWLNKGREVQAAWFNDSWAYRTVYGISNSGSAVSNQKVKVDIDTATLIDDGKMKSACQDARFTDQNGALLKFFIDSDEGPCDNASTDFYVLLPAIAAGDSSFYFYYGNPSAITGASNEFFAPTASLGVKLKGFWPLNEASGTRYDFAHANNLTDNNTVTQTTGHVASAGQFTASSGESLSITDNASLSTGDIDFTLTAWVYLDSKSARRPIAGKFDGTSASQEYLLWYSDSTDRFTFTVRNGGGSPTNLSADSLGSPSTGTWYLLVGWHDSVNNTLNIQVNNGTVDSASYSSGVTDSTTAFEVGHYVSGDHFYMDGRVDAIGLWKKVLTSTERTQLYNGGTGLEFSYLTFTPSSGPTAGTEEKSVGPVAYWAFDEGTGTIAHDSTGNGFNGTLTGDPSWQPAAMCISGMCLKLNGTTDYVSYGAPSTSSILNMTGPMSLSAWVKPGTNQNSDAQIISRHGGYGLGMPSNTALKFYFWGSDLTVNYTFNPGEWYHVAGVYDGTDRKFYVNGKLIGQLASSDPPSASGNLLVGYLYGLGATKYFKGFIDEPKIYNYARSDAEIKLEFNSRGGGGPTGLGSVLGDRSSVALADGLVGYYRMEESSGNLYDDSGNLIELTNNNGVTYVLGKFGNGTEYVPASSRYFSTATTVSGVKTVSFWANPDSTTNYFVNLRSDVYVTASSGVLSATGFANPKIYVNGVLSTTIVADTWQHVTVTTETAIDANQFYVGRQGSNYYDGTLDELRLYSQTLSPSKVVQVYEYAPGPIGYWDFEDANQGSAVADVSGYEHNGSWSGSGTRWTQGKYGKGAVFNGSNDYVLPADVTDFQLTNGTIEAWIKTSAAGSSYRGIIAKQYAYGMFLKDDVFMIYDWGASADRSSGVDLGDGRWHHVAVSFQSGVTNGTTLYVDGVARLTTTMTVSNQSVVLQVGWANAASQYFTGNIDEVRVYNYPRTTKQIVEDMLARGGSALGGKTGGVVGWWDFDEGQGTIAHDRSGNGNNGTLTGMSSPASIGISGWNPNGKFNKALSFDGGSDYVTMGNASSVLGANTSGSVSMWFSRNTNIGAQTLFYWGDSGTNDNLFRMLFSTSSNTLQILLKTSSDLYRATVDLGASASNGSWNSVVFTVDGAGNKVYYNGKLMILTYTTGSSASTEWFDDISSEDLLSIGSDRIVSPNYFNGQIDEVKIYNYALTSAEVQADFNQAKGLVLGSFSDTSQLGGGAVASNSAQAIYCVPGDTASCAPPVAEWEFEEGVGGSVADSAGNVLTGTWNGTGPFWTQGKQGWGGKANGSDSYVETADSSLLNLTGSSFTIQYWIKTSSTGFSTPLMIRDTSGNDSGILGGLPINITTGKASFDTWNYGGNRVTGSVTINDGRWHHIVGTYSSGTGLATLYVDGVIDLSDTQTGSTANANKRLRVGANVGSAGAFLQGFSGSVDGVKVYNYARSPAQVAWDFNKGKAVSYYDFDECQGTVIHNSGVYGTVGTWSGSGGGTQTSVGTCTTSGTTAWYQGRSGKFNGSMNFDGTDDYIDLGNNENVDISGVISISAWVKVASFGSSGQYKGIVSKVTGSSPYGGYQLNTDAESGNRFGLGMNISGTWRSMQTNGTYQTGTWYHLVATYDGSLMKIYVNGKLNNSAAYSGSLELVAQNAFIGKNGSDNANMRFSGQIDDVRIFSYPLTEVQVRQAYNEGFGIRFGPSSGTP